MIMMSGNDGTSNGDIIVVVLREKQRERASEDVWTCGRVVRSWQRVGRNRCFLVIFWGIL